MKPARKREMVDDVRRVWQVSIRRACHALPVDRSSYHYRSKRSGQAVLMKRIKEIAETRVRYGYRRIHVLLRREGWLVNPKRVCRLYREMGLQLRNKSPKRRVKAQLREDRAPASGPNQVWAMDFVHDQLFDGRKIRVLTVVDTFTRLSPAIEVRQQFRGADVVEVLERVIGRLATQRPFGWTMARNLSARTSISGPLCAVSRSTSAGPASRPTMPSSKA